MCRQIVPRSWCRYREWTVNTAQTRTRWNVIATWRRTETCVGRRTIVVCLLIWHAVVCLCLSVCLCVCMRQGVTTTVPRPTPHVLTSCLLLTLVHLQGQRHSLCLPFCLIVTSCLCFTPTNKQANVQWWSSNTGFYEMLNIEAARSKSCSL